MLSYVTYDKNIFVLYHRAHLSKNCPHYKPIIAFHSRHTAWARFPFDGERRKKWHRLVLWEEEVVEDQD